MNKVTLMGRLTRNPELKHVGASGDTPMARYRLAVDRRYRSGNSPEADFIDCVVYGKGVEFAMKYLKKGMKVAVCGRIQTGTYTNSDNQKIYTWGVVVEEHFFAESKNAGNRNADAAGVTDKDGFMEVPDNAEIPFA